MVYYGSTFVLLPQLMHKKITQKLVNSLKAQTKDSFVRDPTHPGFGVKISKAGTISFIAENKVSGGRTRRVTIGRHPVFTVAQARAVASEKLRLMRQGIDPVEYEQNRLDSVAHEKALTDALSVTLGEIFIAFMASRSHKASTKRDYQSTVRVVFNDWLDRPIRELTRRDIEQRFIITRDNRGKPQAAKAMRILSAICKYAMAEEIEGERLLTEDPCDVLNQKRIDRSIPKRTSYLDEGKIVALLDYLYSVRHHYEAPKLGVTDQGVDYILLLLLSGLRKSEAMRIPWKDVNFGKEYFTVRDTKNGYDHSVPMSKGIEHVFERRKAAVQESPWVFPARRGVGHMTEPKSQLQRICQASGVNFTFHDLRRTFATHADINGVSYDLIRRSLNHKSGVSVTDQYIQTHIDRLRPVFQAVDDQYTWYVVHEGEGQADLDRVAREEEAYQNYLAEPDELD